MEKEKTFILIGKQYLPAQGGIENIILQTARFLGRFGCVIIITISPDNRHKLSWWGLYPGAPKAKPYQDCDGNRVYPFSPSLWQRIVLLPIGALKIKLLANWKNGALRPLFYRFFYCAYFRSIKKICGKCAAIQSFEGNFWGLLAHDIARDLNIPFLIAPFMHPGCWGDDRLNIRLYQKSDGVLTLSEYEKAGYKEMAVHERKLFTMSNYPLARPPLLLRKKYGIEGQIVLFLGRKEIYKGYALLIDAWDIVHRELPQAWCVLLGPGFATSKDMVNRIICDGSTNQMPSEYTVFCMPSESETFGLVYIEAWAQAKPIIARPIPAVRELMHDKEAGLLVSGGAPELAERLLALLRDPALCETMGNNGLQIQQTFYSRERFEANLMAIYSQNGCVEFTSG
jgi:phosphatidyl-myo-inositol dimannoside synthase